MKVAIAGAAGRMGKQVIKEIQDTGEMYISVAVDNNSSVIGKDAGEIAGIGKIGVNIEDHLLPEKFDLLIDFTMPSATLKHIEICRHFKKKMIIGTTGFNNESFIKILKLASHDIAIVYTVNFSIGINLMLMLLEHTTRILGEKSNIEIMEIHHRHKKDTPSGTSLVMGQLIASTLGYNLKECDMFYRNSNHSEEKKKIKFSSFRVGDIIGEHTVIFLTPEGEQIEIIHKAYNRRIFANGVLQAAKWIKGKVPGLYNMQDVVKIKYKNN
ncbi:MAG: 4-hydroxy-tetrahydrodipicolinate reductase [Candidatus Dasytiphilus stammeri]